MIGVAERRLTGVTESERVVVMAMLDACFDGFSVSALGRSNVKCGGWFSLCDTVPLR